MGGVLKIRKRNVNSQIEAQAGIGETLSTCTNEKPQGLQDTWH